MSVSDKQTVLFIKDRCLERERLKWFNLFSIFHRNFKILFRFLAALKQAFIGDNQCSERGIHVRKYVHIGNELQEFVIFKSLEHS